MHKSSRPTRTPPPRSRGRRGPAPDPERADLIPTLYRVKPHHHEALAREAEERAVRRWKAEVAAAKHECRPPRPALKRKDASEVLREVLDAWIGSGKR